LLNGLRPTTPHSHPINDATTPAWRAP